jgi:MarR-like DNA-binding transcriptional regulator SgrR of sgrS sRNA
MGLADMHVWLLLFANDLAMTSKSKVGLQKQLDALQQFYAEHGLTVNMKKTKVMVFNSADPCQEFMFEGDVIEHVQTFKYFGILFETTLNLDNVVDI